jgi:UDP-3-O-[3-hydroxymyristoyl] glucosamine N-acyltransferase
MKALRRRPASARKKLSSWAPPLGLVPEGRTGSRLHGAIADVGKATAMKVSDLFYEEMEPALNEWIKRFTSPEELFAAIPQLYAKLRSQNIQGDVEDGAVIIGPVHVNTGAVVRAQAIIRGPAIVGTDTVVSSHAEIQRGCFIGSKCIIGHGCTIIESMVMNNTIVWPVAFIDHSVIGLGSIIGPGAVLGAKGLERAPAIPKASTNFGVILGDRSSVGANSILKPGTVVGPRTIIGEAVLAEGTYGPDQIITVSQKIQIGAERD